MKTIRSFYLFLMGAMAFPAAADAQIADNDASISVLAVQCAVSSGFSASEYEDYCRRLAKTLSLLSSDQQTRVFGYLPMPGAASLGNSEAGANAIAVPGEAGNSDSAATTPTPSNSLLDMVGRFNSLFDGTASTTGGSTTAGSLNSLDVSASEGATTTTTTATATVLGNATTVESATSLPVDSANVPDVGANAGTSNGTATTGGGKSSGGWSSLMAWFEAAEAAYKSGTLSSFLRGGN